ncbi:MAG: hypothetical protein ACFCD0_20540 [Gemmataceae bacterium]
MRQIILRLLKERSSQSFQIHLKNGVVHFVDYPEPTMMTATHLVIGLPGHSPGPVIRDSAIFAITDVAGVELFPPRTNNKE